MQILRYFLLACFLLNIVGCVTPYPGRVTPEENARNNALFKMGYSMLRLRKVQSDSRYSGKFRVNGKPVWLLVDSGANSTDIEERVGKKAGLIIDDSISIVSRGALGRPIRSKIGLGVLTAGPISAEPFPFMLADAQTSHTATSRYDGQIGLDALSGLSALVDLGSGLMWVPGNRARNTTSRGLVPLGVKKDLGDSVLRLRQAGKLPHLLLESRWNGRIMTWIVDTGAEETVLSQESADKYGIKSHKTRARLIDASGDKSPLSYTTLHNVEFKDMVVTRFQVAVASLRSVRKSFKNHRGQPIDGIIGMDFLEESCALLDSKSKLLYVGMPTQKSTITNLRLTHHAEQKVGIIIGGE